MIVKVDCWTCGKIFNTKYSLQEHIRNQHRNRYPNDNRHNVNQWNYDDIIVNSGIREQQQHSRRGGGIDRQQEQWSTVAGRRQSNNQIRRPYQ